MMASISRRAKCEPRHWRRPPPKGSQACRRASSAKKRSGRNLLLALFDGLAIQWLLAPEETPSADRVLHSLTLLAATLTGDARAS